MRPICGLGNIALTALIAQVQKIAHERTGCSRTCRRIKNPSAKSSRLKVLADRAAFSSCPRCFHADRVRPPISQTVPDRCLLTGLQERRQSFFADRFWTRFQWGQTTEQCDWFEMLIVSQVFPC